MISQTLDEEKEADRKLAQLAQGINREAAQTSGQDEEREVAPKHKTKSAGG